MLTSTILFTENLGGGKKKVRAKIQLDNSYAQPYDLPASLFGLTSYAPDSSLTSLISPAIVDNPFENGSNTSLLANIRHGEGIERSEFFQLFVLFPVGGSGEFPSSVPVFGIVAPGSSTADAVDGATPNISPGCSQELGPDMTGLSAYFCIIEAIGY